MTITVNRKLVATYYGGKLTHLDHILPLLPHTPVYVEPFMGSCAVFLNKVPVSKHNILNDANDQIANLFRVIRDSQYEFLQKLKYTPYSRTEYIATKNRADDPVEFARQTMVRLTQSRTHSTSLTGFSRIANMRNSWPIRNIDEITAYLKKAEIECGDAVQLIEGLDAKQDTLIYCDPPYVHSTRNKAMAYSFEMTDEDHIRFLDACLASKHKIAISGYDNDLYAERLKDWKRETWQITARVGGKNHEAKPMRTEILWMNYNPPARGLL